MDETLQMNPQVCGRSAPAQLKPKGGFGARSTPAKQRERALTNGCFLKVQFLRFANPSAVIHDGPFGPKAEIYMLRLIATKRTFKID